MKTDPQRYLSTADLIMGSLIKKVPQPQWETHEDLYRFLVEAIISQQLSDKAASTITKRFVALFSPHSFPTADELLTADSHLVRSAGISFSKISYMKDVAEKAKIGYLDIDHLKTVSDEDVISYLTHIRGIGRWTAEMTLIFALRREDVFSFGDAGLRSAIERWYTVKKPLTEKVAKRISDKWKPYRSWACRYLWASLSLPK